MIYFVLFLLFEIVLILAISYIVFASTLDTKFKMPGTNTEQDSSDKDGPGDLMRPTSRRLIEYQAPLIDKFRKLPFEELEVQSFDGLKLKGWFLKGNPKEVVILVHGYKSSPELDFCDRIKIYQDRGSSILLIHQRSHGLSQGRYIGFSELERFDISEWVNKINSMYDNPDIYLHGVSMGGASVIHTADMNLKNIKGIVDDCGFDSIRNITKALMKDMYKMPYSPIGNVAGMFSKVLAGIDFDKTVGEECVKNTDIPIVFIHGLEDHFVPSYMSIDMYRVCKSKCELLMVVGAGHSAAYMMAEKKYTDIVNRLLDGKIGE